MAIGNEVRGYACVVSHANNRLRMAIFQYKAVTPSGEVMEGVLDADSQPAAISRLQAQGYIPIRAQEAAAGGAATKSAGRGFSLFGSRVKEENIAVFTRELATLLRAGLPLDRCMEILVNLSENDAVRDLLSKIRNDVRGGSSLSKAMDAQKGVFTRFYINMIRAGEAGGALSVVMNRLSDFMERAKELRESVKSALVYPIILLIVAGLSVIFLMTFVVPQFQPIFKQTGQALPWITQLVLGASDIIRESWPVLLIVFAGVVLMFGRLQRSEAFKLWWDKFVLRIPLFGDLIGKIETARLARSLGTLLSNGVPLVNALGIARETMSNSYLAGALTDVGRELKGGRGFGKPLMDSKRFPQFAVHMIMVGEETGRLDDLLNQVAEVYDREVANAVKRLLAMIEPMMILSLGLLIGAIIMSILAALFSIYDMPI